MASRDMIVVRSVAGDVTLRPTLHPRLRKEEGFVCDETCRPPYTESERGSKCRFATPSCKRLDKQQHKVLQSYGYTVIISDFTVQRYA